MPIIPTALVSNGGDVRKFGHSHDINSVKTTVWPVTSRYVWPANATAMTISGVNSLDTHGGTGAEVVEVFGLDSNFNEISEVVSLSGQAAITLVNSYQRIQRAVVRQAGSTGENQGMLYIGEGTVTNGVPVTIYAAISSQDNQTLQAVYTIPAGKKGYFRNLIFSSGFAGNSQHTEVSLLTRPQSETFQVKNKTILGARAVHVVPFDTLESGHDEKTDIEIVGIVNSGSIHVSAAFEMFFVKK